MRLRTKKPTSSTHLSPSNFPSQSILTSWNYLLSPFIMWLFFPHIDDLVLPSSFFASFFTSWRLVSFSPFRNARFRLPLPLLTVGFIFTNFTYFSPNAYLGSMKCFVVEAFTCVTFHCPSYFWVSLNNFNSKIKVFELLPWPTWVPCMVAWKGLSLGQPLHEWTFPCRSPFPLSIRIPHYW